MDSIQHYVSHIRISRVTMMGSIQHYVSHIRISRVTMMGSISYFVMDFKLRIRSYVEFSDYMYYLNTWICKHDLQEKNTTEEEFTCVYLKKTGW